MLLSRRHFMAASAAGFTSLVACSKARDPQEKSKDRPAEPVLGLIFPVARGVPEEGLAMYPSGVRFVTTHLDLKTMTPDGYDKVIGGIPAAAKELKETGAQAITLMGTSLSFYKGAAFNQKLTDTIHDATGLPANTMSTGVIEGLRAVNAKRIAVATAYDNVVNGLLKAFLEENQIEVLVIRGLGITAVAGVNDVKQDELLKFCVSVHKMAPAECDGMLVSCGGLRTLEILDPLEKETKAPVVSSTPHALWAGVRLLGLSGNAPGFGRLLTKGKR